MKKFTLIALLCTAFLLGYGFSRLTSPVNSGPRVTGIGGIFFKAKAPAALKAWYSKNLGIRIGGFGSDFEWHQGMDSTKKGFTIWAPFKETTKYFEKEFMVNYRVSHMDALLATLAANGILPIDTVERASYGTFVHIKDPEGNRIELWEPNDVAYYKMGLGTTVY